MVHECLFQIIGAVSGNRSPKGLSAHTLCCWICVPGPAGTVEINAHTVKSRVENIAERNGRRPGGRVRVLSGKKAMSLTWQIPLCNMRRSFPFGRSQ